MAGGATQARHDTLDRILDTYVRNGKVYYRALKIERAALDRYVASLDVPDDQVSAWPRAEQQAFWLNAYNALVLRTVIDHHPAPTRSADFPDRSIRQIPGSFDGLRYRVGGRRLTLDEIEALMLASFGDARMSLAIGRGAVGGGRLRSEAFRADRIETQLSEAQAECATSVSCVRLDLTGNLVEVSPLVGWREEAFVRSFANAPGAERWANRSPIERAVAAMVYPHVFNREQAMLAENTFRLEYGEFDWRLNDLSGAEEFYARFKGWGPARVPAIYRPQGPARDRVLDNTPAP
jgi:hypothetical protein